MAILGLDSLTGCNSIPDFIATGTSMIFNVTTAPTSWTKVTTGINNRAIRIVTGTVTPGGTDGFSAIFPTTQKAVQVSSGNGADSIAVSPATVSLSLAQTTVNVNSQQSTSTGNTMAFHGHQGARFPGDAQRGPVAPPTNKPVVARGLSNLNINNNGAVPANAQHNHQFPGATSQHNHTTNNTAHTHPTTNSSSHSHTITVASQDFAISYYDVIVATKN